MKKLVCLFLSVFVVALFGCKSSSNANDTSSGDSDADSDGDTDSDSDSDPPPNPPGGIYNNVIEDLPGGEVTACEWEWTIRTIHYHPSAMVPRRMYSASCDTDSAAPKMFTSLTLGENAPHPDIDPSSGGIIVSELDLETGMLDRIDQRQFPECLSMSGIAVSEDCSTIGVLCRVPIDTSGFDVDVLATHWDADWMTQPYMCGDKMNMEMWLYEWTNGDIQSEPRKYIVHKAIGSWEYGNNYLRLGNDESTYGIALKTTVGGADGPDTCHEADAFLVMDRNSETYTDRGWPWACGTGHTTFNRVAYNPSSGKYALMCSTDYNEGEVGGIGAYYIRMEDGAANEFHYMNLDGIKNKGGALATLPRDGDDGFIGVLVGTDEEVKPNGYPFEPPTTVGLVKWDGSGVMDGDIDWILNDPMHYLSYATLSSLGNDTYLVGFGMMRALTDEGIPDPDASMRVPWDFYVMEINGDGQLLTEPQLVEGAGWGELDEAVSLGDGRVGWAYIKDPSLNKNGESPSCNQPDLQLSVYISSSK